MGKYHSIATKVYRRRVANILGLSVDHLGEETLGHHLEEHDNPVHCAKCLCLDGCPLGHRPRKLL